MTENHLDYKTIDDGIKPHIQYTGDTITITAYSIHEKLDDFLKDDMDHTHILDELKVCQVGDNGKYHECHHKCANPLKTAELSSVEWSHQDKTHLGLVYKFKDLPVGKDIQEIAISNSDYTLACRVICEPYTIVVGDLYVIWKIKID